MRSKPENQEKSKHPVGEKEQVQMDDRDKETKNEGEVLMTDKRRINIVDDEAPIDADIEQSDAVISEIEQLQANLKEADEKRIEAERQVRDISERFRHAQAQLKAETEEQRARMQRVFDQKFEAARGDTVASLLDALDNLKRAVAAAEMSERRETDWEALLEGVRATANMFEAKMQGLGLKPITSVGEQFNPEIHEAVEIVSVKPEEDNHVIEEFQTGYRFGDRLLRPARVRVGRAGD
jgi:molecular chaperone GrpE